MAEIGRDTGVIRSIKFPFSFGNTAFPDISEGIDVVLNSLKALLTTGIKERVMRNDVGINVHAYVFDNMTPITRARIAAEVKRAINLYEPRAQVLAIDAKEGNEQNTIFVDIIFRIAGQTMRQQIPVSTT